MKYSKITNSFRIESNEMGSVNAINFGDSSDGFIKDALGFKDTADSRITKASDAVVWIDGKQTSRTTNTFEIAEGLEVTLDPGVNNVGDTMTIKAAPDTESTITNIKKFIEEYNNLLDNLNNLYSTRREKSSTYEYYEPLTDDQRDAMSEKDIEKWEEKAKSGLLYNDPTLGKIITDLRSWMAEGVEVGEGKKISLYDLGIDSNHWSEKGKLTIKDEDKLRKALEERPDDVAALFNKSSDTLYSDKAKRNDRMKEQGLAYRIDDIIQNSIKTSRDADGHRGTLIEKAGMKGTASDTENILHEALKEQDERILQMVQKLTDKEDYYYRMFSAMETAMNKYNSQSSWLSQQFAY